MQEEVDSLSLEIKDLNSVLEFSYEKNKFDEGFLFKVFLDDKVLKKERDAFYEVPNFLKKKGIPYSVNMSEDYQTYLEFIY